MANFEDSVENQSCIDFSRVYNKNEKRVQKLINSLVEECDPRIKLFGEKDLQDVYALALNSLQPRYIQQGTIVVREVVSNEELLVAINDAIGITANHPKI